MHYKVIGLWLVAFVIGLTGCSDDKGPAWHEQDGAWSDIEDVGGTGEDSGTADVEEPSTDVDEGGDGTEDTGPAGPALGRSWMLGTSVNGRPVVAEEFGDSGPILYIMSAIHGSERTAVTFGERFRVPLQGGLAERAGVRVFYMGAANPDGIAINTRHNARDIDLNRNFPADNFNPSGTGGPSPLSEPESVVIHDSIVAIDPVAVISVHCCVGLIDWDGPGESLASRMATAAGFPANRIGSLPGSFGSFSGVDLQIPTITIEFDHDDDYSIAEQLDNMEEATKLALDWAVEEELVAQDFSIYDVLLPRAQAAYTAVDLGLSAGKLSIRGERFGVDATQPVLVVAGIDASDRNTLYVAEHIRNTLLSNLSRRRVQTTVVTAANPDGIFGQSSLNADGEDVATDFGSVSQTPEAQALRDLVGSDDFSVVIVVDAGANGDRIESFGVSAEEIKSITHTKLDVVDGDLEHLPEDSFIRYLREQNVRVLRFAVTTEFAVGNTRNPKDMEKITIFSDAARRMIERRVFPQ